MGNLTHRQLGLCVFGILIVVVLGWRQIGSISPNNANASSEQKEQAGAPLSVEDSEGERVVVHVAGAVREPGVYRLPATARIDDAVARAGGARRSADLSGLNLAAKVQDGRQILVPERTRRGDVGQASSATEAGGSAPADGQPLSLSNATLDQLQELTGVGPATAQKIVDYREEQGGIGSVEELDAIPGIGEARIATLLEEAVP